MTPELGKPEIVGGAAVTPSDMRWDERLAELEFTQLAGVRNAAEKWAASLAATLGLFGTILLVKGREDISKLAEGYEIAAAVMVLLALGCAVAATVQAAYAAQGTPEEIPAPTGRKLRAWEAKTAKAARGHLRCSRFLTIAAVFTLAAAIGVTWFGKAEKKKPAVAKPPSVLVVTKQSGVVCGALSPGAASTLVIKPREKGADAVVIPAAQVVDVNTVAACP